MIRALRASPSRPVLAVDRRELLVASLTGLSTACGIRVVNPTDRATPAPATGPSSDDAVSRIDVQAAHDRWQAGLAVFVDTRGPEAFTAGHIKGAMLMPLSEIDGDPVAARRKLPTGKLAVFYCT